MQSYEFPTPRAACGVIAVALTAITLGIFAVLPAQNGPSERVQSIARAAPPAVTTEELRYIDPVEVVAIRAPRVTSAQERDTRGKRSNPG